MRFARMLARQMGRTLQELGETMTAQEFGEHLSDYMREPWGEQRADLRAGIIASTIANCNRSKNTPAYKPSTFMPFLRDADHGGVASDEPSYEELNAFLTKIQR